MELGKQLLFLFSAIGGLNGLLLSSYFLLIRKEKQPSDYFLGALLLMLSIRVIKSVFLFFNPNLFEFFVQFGLGACFLIGPFLFLYARAMIDQKPVNRIHMYVHLIPYILIVIYLSYFYPYFSHRAIWGRFIEYVIYKQWGIYILLTAYWIRPVFGKIISKKKLADHEFWLLNIFFGTCVVWLAYETSSYTSYIVGAVSFSFLFYTAVMLWFFLKKDMSIKQHTSEKYSNSNLTEEDIRKSFEHLTSFMSDRKPYLDPDLTLSTLSVQLGLNSKTLSQVINQSLSQNFSQYIAHLRVEEAKYLLRSKAHQHLKIAAIAYESGFNSVSAFNHHFKKQIGITAKAYRSEKPI
ncbi:MAG: AraC family transcriptional regulator [Bacteroidota bacterium]